MFLTTALPRLSLSFSEITSFMYCSSCIQVELATLTNRVPLRIFSGWALRAIVAPTVEFQMGHTSYSPSLGASSRRLRDLPRISPSFSILDVSFRIAQTTLPQGGAR